MDNNTLIGLRCLAFCICFFAGLYFCQANLSPAMLTLAAGVLFPTSAFIQNPPLPSSKAVAGVSTG